MQDDLSDSDYGHEYDPNAFVDDSAFSGLSGVSDNESSQIPEVPQDCVAVEMPDSTEFVQIGEGMTYEDIKQALNEKNQYPDLKLYDDQDTLLGDKELATRSQGKTIRAETGAPESFAIRIQDLDANHTIERITPKHTIDEVKKLLTAERNVVLQIFSYRGKLVSDADKLIDIGMTNQEDAILVSRIAVTIIDEACDSVEEIKAYDYWTLEQLIKAYCENQRREPHQNAQLMKDDSVIDGDDSTLFDQDIIQGTQLKYHVPPFPIRIIDSEDVAQNPDGIEIEIEDSWTIEMVLNAYARESTKPFMDGDKIMLLGNILDPAIPVWRLRIARNQELVIEREVQAKALPYLCSECGSIVLLKGLDSVQCRNCFSKILYKKRTTRACQYDCR
jgi:DNA-directed RNA polymerase I, II, and III subunit RPABC4